MMSTNVSEGAQLDLKNMAELDAKGLKLFGLTLAKVSQINRQLTFENPVRLSDTNCLGTEELGAFTYCGPKSELKNASIGRFCSIAPNVAIGAPEHPIDWVSSHPVQYDGLKWFSEAPHWDDFANPNLKWRGNSQRAKIGNDVWIGRNVVIRQGVTIGDGAIIGANSFVNKDVHPYAIVAGQPARLIRYRFSEKTCAALHGLRWWDWMPPKGERLPFDNPEEFIDRFCDLRATGQLRRFEPLRFCVRNNDGAHDVQMLGSIEAVQFETILKGE